MKKIHATMLTVAVVMLLGLGGVFAMTVEPQDPMNGLTGVLTQGTIGSFAIDRKRSADETAAGYHYRAEQGTLVKLEAVSVEPYTLQAGGQVELRTTYIVMIPDYAMQIPVKISYEILYDKDLAGQLTQTVNQSAGTYGVSVPVMLPAKAPAGTYKVITVISSGDLSDARETTFVVM